MYCRHASRLVPVVDAQRRPDGRVSPSSPSIVANFVQLGALGVRLGGSQNEASCFRYAFSLPPHRARPAPPASYLARPGNRKSQTSRRGPTVNRQTKEEEETTGSAGPCSFLVVIVVLAREGKDR